MDDDEREYLDFLTQLIREHQHEETRQQIDKLHPQPRIFRARARTIPL
jgi:hypothetical protein